MTTLERNNIGPWVWEAQRLLILAGSSITNNGIFNELMEQAVKTFQQQKQLNISGKIDDATWKVLGWTDNVNERSLKDADITSVATQLGVDAPAIKAVYEVESKGSGFLPDGRPKILFEGHIFWAQLKKRGKDPVQFTNSNEDILFPNWTKAFYKGNALEYERLSRAKSIDYEAALASASWGTFQIMGFNYKACGHDSIPDYINSCYSDEGEHLKAFANFITSAGLLNYLKNKDWAAFAKGYNGPEYKQNNYDAKLETAYTKYVSKP